MGSADTESVHDCWSRTLHNSLLSVLIFRYPETLTYRGSKDKAREVCLRPLRGCLASSVRLLLTISGLLGRAEVRPKAKRVTQSSADAHWDSSWGTKAADPTEPWETSEAMEAVSD